MVGGMQMMDASMLPTGDGMMSLSLASTQQTAAPIGKLRVGSRRLLKLISRMPFLKSSTKEITYFCTKAVLTASFRLDVFPTYRELPYIIGLQKNSERWHDAEFLTEYRNSETEAQTQSYICKVEIEKSKLDAEFINYKNLVVSSGEIKLYNFGFGSIAIEISAVDKESKIHLYDFKNLISDEKQKEKLQKRLCDIISKNELIIKIKKSNAKSRRYCENQENSNDDKKDHFISNLKSKENLLTKNYVEQFKVLLFVEEKEINVNAINELFETDFIEYNESSKETKDSIYIYYAKNGEASIILSESSVEDKIKSIIMIAETIDVIDTANKYIYKFCEIWSEYFGCYYRKLNTIPVFNWGVYSWKSVAKNVIEISEIHSVLKQFSKQHKLNTGIASKFANFKAYISNSDEIRIEANENFLNFSNLCSQIINDLGVRRNVFWSCLSLGFAAYIVIINFVIANFEWRDNQLLSYYIAILSAYFFLIAGAIYVGTLWRNYAQEKWHKYKKIITLYLPVSIFAFLFAIFGSRQQLVSWPWPPEQIPAWIIRIIVIVGSAALIKFSFTLGKKILKRRSNDAYSN